MKTKLTYLIPFLLLAACTNEQQKEHPQQTVVEQTKTVAPQKVVINELHDTLQPKVTYLSEVPPAVVSLSLSKTKPQVHSFAPNIAQGKGLFTTYTSDDGLAMDAINYGKSTICDSEGNIWFATQGGGVSKYDGKSFSTYTTAQGLANNSVLSICEDKSGNLWFGTYGGGVSLLSVKEQEQKAGKLQEKKRQSQVFNHK